MIIVTEQVEARVQQRLEQIAIAPSGWRCIHLKPSVEVSHPKSFIKDIADTVQQHLHGLSGGMYFSGLGHIWIIYKHELSPSQAAQVFAELRRHFAEADLVVDTTHYDLKVSLHEVLHGIERLLLPPTLEKKEPEKKFSTDGTMHSRLADFLTEIPPATYKELARTRAMRQETVVLVVEDDPFYARLIDKVLSRHARVVVANNADQVMEEYVICAPDVVLLDIGLPEVSGHELLKAILTLDPAAYIVMASGNSFKDDVMGAMQVGAKGFITKPFSREKIIRAVNLSPTITAPIAT